MLNEKRLSILANHSWKLVLPLSLRNGLVSFHQRHFWSHSTRHRGCWSVIFKLFFFSFKIDWFFTENVSGWYRCHSSGYVYDIPIWVVVAQWFRYEIVVTNSISRPVPILIVPNVLVGLGCTISSSRTRRFTQRIYGAFHDQCLVFMFHKLNSYVELTKNIICCSAWVLSFVALQIDFGFYFFVK